MSFYNRKIQYYKSFKLIDSDGDGIKDTIVYSPISNYYHIQFSLEQDIKNIGNYIGADTNLPEIILSGSIWKEGANVETQTKSSTSASRIVGGQSITYFCNDPQASNYDPSLVGVTNYLPCEDRNCCTYSNTKSYVKNKSVEDDLNCLAFYTDWGPWNDELILNDTKQTHIKKVDCTFSLRLINLLSIENEFVKGGWYGASLLIEVDSGDGYKPLEPGNPIIYNIDKDIIFNQENKTYTLSDKVRVWKSVSNTKPVKYFTTKPYRDISFKPSNNYKIKVTYLNANDNISLYEKYANSLRLQVVKGTTPLAMQTPPTPTEVLSGYTWSQNIENITPFLGSPMDRQNDGETFHYIKNGEIVTKNLTWQNYLDGYKNKDNFLPWGPSFIEINAGSFYTNPSIQILNDFGDNNTKNILSESVNTSLKYFSNPSETLGLYTFTCEVKENYISFFDKDGDGFIESGTNGSVDDGLFSKTRYDSPYIFIKPGTKDGTEIFTENPLTVNSVNDNDYLISPSSTGGWKNYAYVTSQLIKSLTNIVNYSYKNVSPTCQMGGVNNLFTTEEILVDPSNASLFLQQPTLDGNIIYSDYGTGTTVPHTWNYGFNKSNGGCCAKKYSTTVDMDNSGPYLNGKCSTCHGQMTPRSAQPVLNNSVRIAMQTTDSEIYYGPFYDPQNPSYNGYGLAFSKANNFCRNVKSKNGVQIINSEPGVDVDEMFMGGILHGGGVQYRPSDDFSDSYGVYKSIQLGFDEITPLDATTTCSNGTKIPLKCSRTINDPNCPKNNCMKCIFCFKCSTEDKQVGVFTGDNSDLKGPTNGITYLG